MLCLGKIQPLFWLLVLVSLQAIGQKKEKAFIKLTEPIKSNLTVSDSKVFIIGSTCKTCTIKVNEEEVKVYPTGAFAKGIQLKKGVNEINVEAIDVNGKTSDKKLRYVFQEPPVEKSTEENIIEYVQTIPAVGDVWLKAGDEIQFRVKAKTGCNVTTLRNTPLMEIPDSLTKGIKGIYQGIYVVKSGDELNNEQIPVMLTAPDSSAFMSQTKNRFTKLSSSLPIMCVTRGRLAHLEYGWGDDRLGGAKMGYIDSLIPLEIIGKWGTEYKVRLTDNRTAFIPEEHVNMLPPGVMRSKSLTGKIRATAKDKKDLVQVQLFKRLPYHSFQQISPNQIIVDIFGATNNTNWIDQPDGLQEIKEISYEQVGDDQFRMFITLKHKQSWGYEIHYEGNNLVIAVRTPPNSLTLKGMRIALDAGHGGSNTGAGGALGIAEKTLTLQVVLKMKALFEQEGALVTLTRVKDSFFDNKERLLFYRDSIPDLLLSFHLNSSADPFGASGTSVFYKHIGFRNLGKSIHKRMLSLGLDDYGNNGSFNFMLNGATEYPNALIEALFLSNLEEEMMIIDESFQEKMAEQIVMGVKDFLNECE